MEDEKSFIDSLTDDDKRRALAEALSNFDFSKARLVAEKANRAFERAVKSKPIADFVRFINDFSLEKAVHGLILKVAEEALQRDGLDKNDTRYLTEARDKFLLSFAATMSGCESPEQRQSALDAILSAFVIASHGGDQKALTQGVLKALTDPAHKARKAEPVQEIIERQARELWARNDTFKNNDLGTANTILSIVTSDLLELLETGREEIPPKWIPLGNPSKADDKRTIGRIAGRLKRIKRSDR